MKRVAKKEEGNRGDERIWDDEKRQHENAGKDVKAGDDEQWQGANRAARNVRRRRWRLLREAGGVQRFPGMEARKERIKVVHHCLAGEENEPPDAHAKRNPVKESHKPLH